MRRGLVSCCLLLALAGGACEPAQAQTALPAGFAETLVTTASDLSAPAALELSPAGEVWVLEQGGRAKLIRADGTARTALTLTVDSAGERGLLGIAFDSSYDGGGPNADLVYLYYTAPRSGLTSPSHNRLSRFTVTGAGTATPTLGGELILRELPPEDEDNNLGTDGDAIHNGGAIHFGPDGKLYVAVGDHNYDNTPQSAHVSQTLTSPFGKILRLNLDGTNASDNPFYMGSATDWRGAIWALGLRNPYTFASEPGSGRMFLNDVGESAWEEINDGVAGANYGWAGSTPPLWEGFEEPSPPPWANYYDPIMAYDHDHSVPTPPGCAVVGGAFYPSGGSFGGQYAGKYFFADFCGDWIRVFDPARPGSPHVPDTSSAFAMSLTGASPVDLEVDADGSLYYLARGAPGEVYRISNLSPGLRAEFFDYTNRLSRLPNLAGRTPDVARTDATINYPSTRNPWEGLGSRFADTFASRHTGYVRIPTTGSYTLYLRSNDGSRLWLDGQLLIDNDGLHSMRERSATRTLAAGDHMLRVQFFENTGPAGLILSWTGPGIARQVVPASQLFQTAN